jgi:hypothetical protein
MYYLISDIDGALLDSRDKLPTMERLQEMANDFGCSFYVLQGEHTGISIAAREDCLNICGECDGTGEVDSGGFSPWGTGIDVTCPTCNGTGRLR